MNTAVWISGASSGIGAALAASVPFDDARVIGIARRPPAAGEHLPADLSRPADWDRVVENMREVVLADDCGHAVFAHFAGVGSPHGPASAADGDEYRSSVLLNAASGIVLGQAFLAVCAFARVPAVLVMCSSPGALEHHRGMAHYGAAKAALLHWTEVVRDEELARAATVLSVIPWATDTPMLRDAALQDPEANPLSGALKDAYARGDVASADDVAREIWFAVLAGAPVSPLHVGRPPR